MQFIELNEKEFLDFAIKHPLFSHYQTPAEARVKEVTDWHGKYYGVIEDEKIVAAAFVMKKKVPYVNKYIFQSPRGLLADYHNKEVIKYFSDNLYKLMKKEKGIFLMIDPYLSYQNRDKDGNIIEGINNQDCVNNLIDCGYKHTGFNLGYENIQPRFISVVPVKDKTYEEVFSNFAPKRRQQLHQVDKLGLTSREITHEELSEFVKLEEYIGNKRGFGTRSLEYYEKMWKEFNPDFMKIVKTEMNIDVAIKNIENSLENVITKRNEKLLKLNDGSKINSSKQEKMIIEDEKEIASLNNKITNLKELKAKHGDKPTIAIIQYMTTPREITALAIGSNDDFIKYNVIVSGYDWGIRYAIDNKMERFNFYGISGDFSSNNPQYGIFKMKKEFGATVEELIGEFHLIVSPLWYFLYNVAYKIKG